MPNSHDKRRGERTTKLKPTQIKLKGKRFQVSDISNDGIGFIIEDDGPPFVVGERLAAIPIPLEDGAVIVQGVVSHISVTTAGRKCGINFVFSGEEYDAIIRFKAERMKMNAGKESL